MQEIDVDGLRFSIKNGFRASKYDDWVFYRQKLNCINNSKAIDLIVLSDDGDVAYLIEAKDYRYDPISGWPRIMPTNLPGVVAQKVLAALGGILAARLMAEDVEEKRVASVTCKVNRLRVVLQLEHNKDRELKSLAYNPASIQMKLRQLLKAIDNTVIVNSKDSGVDLPWTVV